MTAGPLLNAVMRMMASLFPMEANFERASVGWEPPKGGARVQMDRAVVDRRRCLCGDRRRLRLRRLRKLRVPDGDGGRESRLPRDETPRRGWSKTSPPFHGRWSRRRNCRVECQI